MDSAVLLGDWLVCGMLVGDRMGGAGVVEDDVVALVSAVGDWLDGAVLVTDTVVGNG